MDFLNDIVERVNEQSLQNKIGVLVVLVLVISGVYWYFFWSPKAEEISQAEARLRQLENKVREYEAIAAELPKFEKEFERLNREFQVVARKLPKEKEIPALIDSVYSEISASNLDSIIFAPQGQVPREIYAEIPVQMEVIGSYYNLADFFDRLSRLPRIVNVRNLELVRNNINGSKVMLNAKFNVVTFRLLPPPPVSPAGQDTKGKRKRK